MKCKQTPVASAVALVLMSAAWAAHAQQAPAPAPAPAAESQAAEPAKKAAADAAKLETVTVTGIRGSLQQSISAKRNADSVVEVITAEDIGKMPDKNVADSLQRVPGVTISAASASEGGFDENDRVSLRGTNPSLTQTTINGHMVSSGDWFVLNQVGTVGRSVSYSLLPSELVGQVVVRKSSTADVVEGGAAGSVDILTRRPLDFRKPLTVEAAVGAVYADLPGETDPQFNGLINWKSDEGNAGVLFQVFSEKRHLRRDGQEMLGYEQIAPGSAIALSNPDLAGVYYPRAIGSALFEQVRERQGGMIDAQIKPTNDITLGLNGFISKMKADNINRNFLVWPAQILRQGAGLAPLPGYTVRNNTLVSADFAAVDGQTYGIYDQISRPGAESETKFINFDGKWAATDRLSFGAQLGKTTGKGVTPEQSLFSALVRGSGAGFDLHGAGNAADASIGTADPSQPNVVSALDWIYGASPAKTKDDEKWAQVDGEYAVEAGAFSAIKFGLRRAEHKRTSSAVGQGPLGSTDPTDPTSGFNPANFPAWGGNHYPGNFGNGLGGTFPKNIFIIDPGTLNAWGAQYSNRDPITRRNWTAEFEVEETNTAGYLMGTFEGKGWSGNVGVRIVRTEEDVLVNVPCTALDVTTCPAGTITTSAFGPFFQQHVKNSYTDVLPSANLRYDLAQDVVGRLAASKTMARPDYSSLGGAVSLNDTLHTGSGGNPNLEPIISTNFDASVEWYFAPRSLAQAGLFYMDLKNYVSYGISQQTYRDLRADPTGNTNAVYDITSPINSDGKVKGIELAWQQPIWGNFGAIVNYTYADGEEDGGGPLVGMSKNTYNIVGYYEDERFNARLAYNYRSSFYNGLDRSSAQFQDDVGVLAASFGVKINDTFSVSLDIQNLNEPKLAYYANNKDQPLALYNNGRQYYLMLRAKM